MEGHNCVSNWNGGFHVYVDVRMKIVKWLHALVSCFGIAWGAKLVFGFNAIMMRGLFCMISCTCGLIMNMWDDINARH